MSPPIAPTNPWDQQPDESGKAFGAFKVYRDLGAGRSLDAAWRGASGARTGPNGGTRAPGRWRTWHKANRWDERARAFDARDDRVADAAHTQAVAEAEKARVIDIAEFRRAELKLALSLLNKAQEITELVVVKRKVVKGPHGEIVTIIEPAKGALASLARIAQAGSDIARKNLSLPTKVDTADAGQDAPLFETSGEIEAAMPPGSMPPMPADTHVKPDLAAVVNADNSTLKQPAHAPRPPAGPRGR